MQQQRSAKRIRLAELFAAGGHEDVLARTAQLTTPAGLGFRAHLDLRWDGQRLGLLGVEDPAVVDAPKVVIDMERCPLVVPALAFWLEQVRRNPLPIARASLRLRVGAGALRGIGIDCANLDVKALLDEGRWLDALLALGPDVVIELGAKARRVRNVAGRSSLGEPELHAWSTTQAGARALWLYTGVRAFSQPGPLPNRALVAAVLVAVQGTHARRVLELGAGAGNLTLPLLAAGLAVRAVELDGTALARSAHEADLDSRLEIEPASFERAEQIAPLTRDVDTILADPPRQGLGRFIDGLGRLSPGLLPPHIVYVSCHPEALAADSARLSPLGYRLSALAGVDQFPWTPHAEWVATFTRP